MLNTERIVQAQPIVLHMRSDTRLSDDQFFDLCQQNRDWRFELTAEGDIIIMAPAGGESSAGNLKLSMQLGLWAERDGTGVAFDSSAGFRLPSGATRSPDGAWIHRSRLAQLDRRQKRRFIPLCPDFVVELRSPTDALDVLKDKMAEYIANGASLGWLLDPDTRQVYVYRPNQPVEHLHKPTHLSGDPILPGFTLTLAPIWEPGL